MARAEELLGEGVKKCGSVGVSVSSSCAHARTGRQAGSADGQAGRQAGREAGWRGPAGWRAGR
eukprot:21634-Chlamydomonas_euryale.AAC.2